MLPARFARCDDGGIHFNDNQLGVSFSNRMVARRIEMIAASLEISFADSPSPIRPGRAVHPHDNAAVLVASIT